MPDTLNAIRQTYPKRFTMISELVRISLQPPSALRKRC